MVQKMMDEVLDQIEGSGIPEMGTEVPELETQYEVIDGYRINPETGEVLGVEPPADCGEDFKIDTEEKVNWVLEKWLREEAAVEELEIRAKAIAANLAIMKRQRENRIAALQYRFGQDLEEYARKQLQGKRAKSIQTCYGKLAFRKVSPKIEVNDEEAAAHWILENAPESEAAQVTFRFYKSKLSPEMNKAIISGETQIPGLEVTPERELFSVKTGVKP